MPYQAAPHALLVMLTNRWHHWYWRVGDVGPRWLHFVSRWFSRWIKIIFRFHINNLSPNIEIPSLMVCFVYISFEIFCANIFCCTVLEMFSLFETAFDVHATSPTTDSLFTEITSYLYFFLRNSLSCFYVACFFNLLKLLIFTCLSLKLTGIIQDQVDGQPNLTTTLQVIISVN